MELEQLRQELDSLKQGVEQDRYNRARDSWYGGVASDLMGDSSLRGVGDTIFDTLYSSGGYSEEATFALIQRLQEDINKISSAIKMIMRKLPQALESLKDRADQIEQLTDASADTDKAEEAVDSVDEAMADIDSITDDASEASAAADEQLGDDIMSEIDAASEGLDSADAIGSIGDGGDAPPDMDDGGLPADDTGGGDMPPDGGGGDLPPPEPAPEPQGTTSDARVKDVRRRRVIDRDAAMRIVSDFREKNVVRRQGTLSRHLIDACRGGY